MRYIWELKYVCTKFLAYKHIYLNQGLEEKRVSKSVETRFGLRCGLRDVDRGI